MIDEERKGAAQAILAIPLFNALMDEIERTELHHAIYADVNDHETRMNRLSNVRAIRDLRSRIGALAQGQPSGGKKAPA